MHLETDSLPSAYKVVLYSLWTVAISAREWPGADLDTQNVGIKLYLGGDMVLLYPVSTCFDHSWLYQVTQKRVDVSKCLWLGDSGGGGGGGGSVYVCLRL